MNPMKPPSGIAALALASLVIVGPSFAAEPTAPNTTRETAAPAKKPSSFALPHHVTGSVMSVNRNAQMFTLKAADGTTLTLNADPAVAPQLRDLKKGERVKVTYKESKGQQVATKVTPA
jgi:hypothetical protein